MYRIIPLRMLRRTRGVMFDEMVPSDIPKIDGIDRVIHGFVIDFIDIYLGSYHWPAFNIADSSITLGFILIMFNILFLNKKI